MIDAIKKSYNDNKGSAIITGLVVSTVLMVLCLSLILVAYSLFISTTRTSYDLTQREMLYSAIESFELEFTDVSVQAVKDELGNDDLSLEERAKLSGVRDFWVELFDSITKQSWAQNSSRYFNLSGLGDESEIIVVELWWQSSDNSSTSTYDGTQLYAIYRMYDNYTGEELVKTERKYVLSAESKNIVSIDSDENNNTTNSPITSFPGNMLPKDDRYVELENENGILVEFRGKLGDGNAEFRITNNSGHDIEGWNLYVEILDSFTSGPWVAEKQILENGYYLLKNYNYNGTIKNGESISMPFNTCVTRLPKASFVYTDSNGNYVLPAWASQSKQSDIEKDEYLLPALNESRTVFSNSDVEVYFKGTAGSQSAEITIHNKTNNIIEYWMIDLSTIDKISLNSDKSRVYSLGDGRYIFKYPFNNQDVTENGDFVFHFYTDSTKLTHLPKISFVPMQRVELLQDRDYSIEYHQENRWKKFIKINNLMETLSIDDWILQIDYEGEIVQIYDHDFTKLQNNQYLISHGNNSDERSTVIAPLKDYEFGFQANNDNEPSNYKLFAFIDTITTGLTTSEIEINEWKWNRALEINLQDAS